MLSFKHIHTVSVGSLNPVKIQAVRDTFTYYCTHMINITGVAAISGVSEMPMSMEETKVGSHHRAIWCIEQGGVDFSVGLEGGVQFVGDDGYLFGCVTCMDRTGYYHTCIGTQFLLPPLISMRLKEGEELGPLMDELLGMKDTKKGSGTIGFLTREKIPRKESFIDIVTHAIIPWLHPDLYTV